VSRYAPILQEVAGRIAGESPLMLRSDPVRWAYVLRDAVALAQPDVVVSHFDDQLEADAVLARGSPGGDWITWLLDAPPLAALPPVAAAVELVSTLAGIYRAGPSVAATLTGPVTVAALIAPHVLPLGAGVDERVELADLVADHLAALAGAYADAGAGLLIAIEREGFLNFADARARLLEPLVRAAGHRRIEFVVTRPGRGIAPELWSLAPEQFVSAWQQSVADAPELLLTDGPIPAQAPLEMIRMARGAAFG
jgi:hypothetical protein